MYTDTQYFQHADSLPRVLVVKANGGHVDVEVFGGNGWVTTDTYAVDAGVEVFFGFALIRITPTGGAEYDVL